MVYPDTQIGRISENILGLTESQATALNNNGWVNLRDLIGYETKDIMEWTYNISKLPATRGGVVFATIRVRRLCALAYWVEIADLCGDDITEDRFTAEALTQSIRDYRVYDLNKDSDDSVDKPDMFSYNKWVEWHDSIIIYLKGTKNVTKNIPLYYIIRPDEAPADPTLEERIIHHASHNGVTYTTDNQSVHRILAELTNGTDADQWIKEYSRNQDGRGAWNALCQHYDGPAEGDKRVTVARHDLKTLHYKNESSFSFETYSTKMRKAFSTLKQYNQPRAEKEQVELLIDNMNTNDTRLITVIGICRDSHSTTFEEACTYLSSQIAILFPQHQPNSFGRKGKGGKKPTFRNVSAVVKKNGKVTCNGVDISDTTKYFSKTEFTKMGKEGREYLNKCPKRKAAKVAHSAKKRNKTDQDDPTQRQIAAIINGVMQASRHEQESTSGSIPSQVGGNGRMPQHGPHARQSNAANSGTRSIGSAGHRYDHNGDIIPPNA